MTAPFEIEEAEPIPLSSLVHVRCVRCRAPRVACAPGQQSNALCGPCRSTEARSATRISRLPAVAPPRMVVEGSEKILAPEPSQRVELIPPELVCGDFCGHAQPGPVTELWRTAVDAGWSALVRHSRARNMQADGKQGAKVEDFWSVRFRRDDWAGYAVRRGDLWDSVCITGVALPPFLALGMTDLRQWLAAPERPDGVELGAWVAGISKRVRDQGLASKQVRCPGPGECAWVDEARGDHTHRANGDIKIKKTRKDQASGF